MSSKTSSSASPERPFTREGGSYYEILEMKIVHKAACPLTDAEEDLMFECGEFGDHDPKVLQRTLWWLLSLHFGFRARDESKRIKWGNVKFQSNVETSYEELVWIADRGSNWRPFRAR